MDDFLSGILDMEVEETVIPSGEGFRPGFVGPITAALRWQMYSVEDLEEYDEYEGQFKGKFTRRGTDGKYWYYFEDKAIGIAASELMDAYAPGQVWRFEIPTKQVLNFATAEAGAGWGETVGLEAGIKTLRSKYRHEFHMICLPSIVNALALHIGWLEESQFDLSVLLDADEGMFDEEFQARMIGGEGVKWEHSTLWEQRARLWSALGEDNPKVYNPIGSDTAFDTTSKKLSKLFGVVTRPWVKPMWGRLVLVPDPRYAATFTGRDGDVKRLSIPALTEVYGSKKLAKKAVEEEGAVVTESEKVDGELVLPEQWSGFAGEWKDELGKLKVEQGGALPPKPVMVKWASDNSCEVDDMIAWWGEV